MTKRNKSRLMALRVVLFLLLGWLLFSAGREFHEIAWGTGYWYGEFSFKWLVAFLIFVLIVLSVFWLAAKALFLPQQLKEASQKVVRLREQNGTFRWILSAGLLFAPVILFQYIDWGFVFKGFYLRVLIWAIVIALVTMISTRSKKTLAEWPAFWAALVLSATVLSLGAAVTNVTDYPFSLGWSEGNRLYDYSLLFGKKRYIYSGPAPRPFLDIGRELLGGLPFLIPGLDILGARLWLAILALIPYLVFGWVAFGLAHTKQEWRLGAVGALWAFLFVKQGPIHPPLMLCAILIALAWGRRLWISLPIVVLAGYFAQASRNTWMFAPAMWIAMIEFSSAKLKSERVSKPVWVRSLSLTAAGLIGGVLPILLQISRIPGTDQPLLWYRLLPNATFGTGILLGLFLATGPLIGLLLYLAIAGRWKLNLLQRLLLAGSLFAFLIVGLIVSTKIGGGGDLHNMDMFIIGLAFTASIAWRSGGSKPISSASVSAPWLIATLTVMLTVFGMQPLMKLHPLGPENLAWVMTLTGTENPRAFRSLPRSETVANSLATIQTEANLASQRGEVLFMDQRQLLTFGFVEGIPLISEYEKKVLMNEALSGDADFFAPFYEDLENARFELIVTEPLFTPIKDEEFAFGEESNAWVTWISRPLLCYYEPIEWLVEVHVQLLVPRAGDPDCSKFSP